MHLITLAFIVIAMSHHTFRYLLFVLLMITVVVLLPVAAVTMSLTPTTVQPSATITITILNLADGSDFDLSLSSTDLTSTGQTWYNLTNFAMPFTLVNGTMTATGGNLDRIALYVKKASTGPLYSVEATGNGSVNVTAQQDVTAGTYSYILINGDIHTASQPVSIAFTADGTTKDVPSTAVLSFVIEGASAGHIRVLARVNGTTTLDQTITITTQMRRSSNGGGGGSAEPFITGSTTVPELTPIIPTITAVTTVTSPVPSVFPVTPTTGSTIIDWFIGTTLGKTILVVIAILLMGGLIAIFLKTR